MERTRAYRREVRNKQIARKKRIVKTYSLLSDGYYKFDGQYSKGKIHCSCPLCTYSKYYDFPRLKDYIDRDRVKDALIDASLL